MKKILLSTLALPLLFTLTNCNLGKKQVKVDDIEITLPAGFVEKDLVNTYYCAQTTDVVFAVVRLDSSLGYTESSYLDYALKSLNIEATQEKYESENLNFTYCYYTNEVQGSAYQYFDCLFTHNSYLYDFEFFCKENKADKYKDEFLNWAKTITFVTETEN